MIQNRNISFPFLVNLCVCAGLNVCIIHLLVILHIYAFFWLQEGKEYLLKSVGLWLPAQKQSAASSSSDEDVQVSVSCVSLVFP